MIRLIRERAAIFLDRLGAPPQPREGNFFVAGERYNLSLAECEEFLDEHRKD